MVSSIPRAVKGLTNDDAPSLAVAPAGKTRHAAASTTRYCVYIAPPAIPTVFPSRACAADDDPATTTVPAPSLPTGSGLSIRAESPARAPAPNDAVTMGRSGVPSTVAVVMSAPGMRTPKSDGLIGEASTRTNTSLVEGVGTGTSCRESSSVPCDVTVERSSSALSGKIAVIGSASFLLWTSLQPYELGCNHGTSRPSRVITEGAGHTSFRINQSTWAAAPGRCLTGLSGVIGHFGRRLRLLVALRIAGSASRASSLRQIAPRYSG